MYKKIPRSKGTEKVIQSYKKFKKKEFQQTNKNRKKQSLDGRRNFFCKSFTF